MNEIKQFIEPDLLQDNCYLSVEEEIRHDYTPEEIADLKSDHFKISLYQHNREAVLNKVKETLNQDIDSVEIREVLDNITLSNIGDKSLKVLKAEFKESILIINQGYLIKKDTLYGFDYQEIGRMAFYRSDGHFHHDRPLKAEERQRNIATIPITKSA
jgi:hypothetical protein